MTLAIGGDPIRAVTFSVVIACLASFGFLLNDIWDRDVDRVNKAGHFEHSDAITIRVGRLVGSSFLIGGLGIALWLGLREFILASIIALALTAYTILLRKLLIIPTIVAAVLATSPLWTPMVLWPKSIGLLKYVFLTAIIIIVAARETLMDARDRLGDTAGGRHTLATVFGERIAKFVGVTLTISASVLLGITVVYSASTLAIGSMFIATGIGGAIIYLLVSPAVATLHNRLEERSVLKRYVLWSRTAMALIPPLNLILWQIWP
jgi:4-hydroxybenzoate polyprenyltransferase